MNTQSALETTQAKFSRRSFFRGAAAALPLAAIPAGAALAENQMPAAAAGDLVLNTMHDRAQAAWQEWSDLPLARREYDEAANDKACKTISDMCAVMRQIPAKTAAAARMKIAVGELKFEFFRGQDGEPCIVGFSGGTAELKKQGEIELAALA